MSEVSLGGDLAHLAGFEEPDREPEQVSVERFAEICDHPLTDERQVVDADEVEDRLGNKDRYQDEGDAVQVGSGDELVPGRERLVEQVAREDGERQRQAARNHHRSDADGQLPAVGLHEAKQAPQLPHVG